MKPYGREKKIKHFSGKQDVHPKRGFMNWWEAMSTFLTRSSMKQKIKKEIDTES
jgi:hypothetical protein